MMHFQATEIPLQRSNRTQSAVYTATVLYVQVSQLMHVTPCLSRGLDSPCGSVGVLSVDHPTRTTPCSRIHGAHTLRCRGPADRHSM